jgi:hypothetical protein
VVVVAVMVCVCVGGGLAALTGDQHPQAQVELAAVQQQRVGDVCLRNLELLLHLARARRGGRQLQRLLGGRQLEALAWGWGVGG